MTKQKTGLEGNPPPIDSESPPQYQRRGNQAEAEQADAAAACCDFPRRKEAMNEGNTAAQGVEGLTACYRARIAESH